MAPFWGQMGTLTYFCVFLPIFHNTRIVACKTPPQKYAYCVLSNYEANIEPGMTEFVVYAASTAQLQHIGAQQFLVGGAVIQQADQSK